ncbi:glycosyltransferase family 2 protein [Nesterenkonia massiliensis]|uniref:glycosyltransferase family 2 protein n=1 Tax=Nesterenkonia massiliensis TaxID=1232429 RepID=UPI00040484D7|nr:glycosyltransferase family 2 protein [Nesterenkonia massiliensis]
MKHKIVNFRADRISGWFYDPEAGDARGVLDLLVADEPVASLPCKVFRRELSPDEFPTRNVGFLGSLPPEFWTGETHAVSLRDRRTGRILTQEKMQTDDLRLPTSPGFSGEFQVTDQGQIAGWAARGPAPVSVRVFVDGHQVDDSVANHSKVLWMTDQLDVTAPPGFAYSFQVPAEYFDDASHRIQVIGDPESEEILLLERTVRLEARYAARAAEATERLRTGKSDWSEPWRKAAQIRSSITVTRFELTPSYAAVTVVGDSKHSRAVLRLGENVVPLTLTTGLHPDDEGRQEQHSQRCYAGEIPSSVQVPSELALFSPGAELGNTFDVRMGDESGRRPAGLSTVVVSSSESKPLASTVEWDAGCLEGWVLDLADLHVPESVVLRAVTPEGPVELVHAEASSPVRELREKFGVRGTGGYSLPLPADALTEEPVHLQAAVTLGTEERVLWEDHQFRASDNFLLDQALSTGSTEKLVELLRRLRAAGRGKVVKRFLTRHKDAAVKLKLKDFEAALTSQNEAGQARLAHTTGAVWYWVNELRANAGRIQWFTQNAVRNRMSDARDVLAYAATKGRFDFAQLHGLLESSRADLFRVSARRTFAADNWTTATLCLARFLFSAPRDEIDFLDALTLYRMVEDSDGLETVRGTDRAYYGELLSWRGDFDASWRVLTAGDTDPDHDYSQKLLALNAINPHVAAGAGSTEAWLSGFNALLDASGVAPIQLGEEELSFYNLTADLSGEKVPVVESGPLVSVIVPIYEPSAATNIAVKSLLGQTWRNLEIIIVDDCSPATDEEGRPTSYREQLESFAAADERIRLVFAETNRGSYSVRNDALDMATGEFVTVADKDDWHHPQQIELQVRHLQQNPDAVANMTNWARVDEHLKLMLRSATGRVVYPSMPSLMFRREKVLKDLGYWDTVRKSGDSEFKSRMENFYGVPIELVGDAPLAFALMEGENLTRNDMGVGYLAPERRAYLRGYKRWHREIREEGVSPYMPKGPEQRRFVAPPAYLPNRPTEPLSYDVVFASEFGFVAGNSTSLFTEISVCLDAGLRVAVIPFQNGLIPSAAKRQFNRRIDELVLSGQIDRISLDTEAEADLLIVRWPTALQAVRDEPALLRAKRAVVVANHPPFEPGGRRSYDIGVVTRNVEKLFGVRPTWAPQSEQIGAMLEPLMPASDLESFSWKGIIEIKDSASRNRYHEGTPVIGRHGRDDPAKWPSDRSVFRSVYPVDGTGKVCILGGANVPVKRGFLPRNAPGWEIYAFNEITVEEYLTEKLDFFVYFHSDDWVEAFGMAILEAMSYGVVCVLPNHFEPVFKDAAVYAEPAHLERVISDFWNESAYKAQQVRAVQFIESECTPSAYLSRLRKFAVKSQS